MTVTPIEGIGVGSLVGFARPGGDILGRSFGIVLNVNESTVQASITSPSDSDPIQAGFLAFKVSDVFSIDASANLLGTVIDPMGNVLRSFPDAVNSGAGIFSSESFNFLIPVESPAPGIIDRTSVSRPLPTGTKIVDTLFPIGKGQRELIIGDRQTGKTSLAVDSIISQYRSDTYSFSNQTVCVYVSVGQKNSTVYNLVSLFTRLNCLHSTILVVASASDSASYQYLAPYTGCAIGEFFRDLGLDVLIVYDDLSKHATAYRQLSLILRRPPGREAYPGDVFYLHSRLLERSAQLSPTLGEGSITALPIVETQAGDISSYIPTNVISITDGQIFLESDLFYQGIRPAVNVGLSVSRVGSKAQFKPIRELASLFKSDMAQYRESLAFARFGSDLDPETLALLSRGARYVELFKQKNQDPYTVEELLIVLFAAANGFFGRINVSKVNQVEVLLVRLVRNSPLFRPFMPFLISEYSTLSPVLFTLLDLIFTPQVLSRLLGE